MTTHIYTRLFPPSTAIPDSDYDSDAGYEVGDIHISTTDDKIYQAINVDPGNAVWEILNADFTPGSGVDYTGTKAALTAAGFLVESDIVYATDTNEFGAYNGSSIDWISKTYFDTLYSVLAHTHSYQPLDTELTGLAGVTSAADSFPYFTGSGTAALLVIVSAIRTLLASANVATFRTNAGLAIGTDIQAYSAVLATLAGASANGQSLITAADYAAMRTLLGVAPIDAWISDANTWTYSSADAPTFVISVNADMTAILGAGDRIKLTQTSAKYFIVTAVGSFSGGATLITVYGGTDYTLANAAISSPYYSHAKHPFGFPVDPDKWTVEVTDTTLRTQATPTQNTWYNNGSISISAPIGKWLSSYEVEAQAQKDTSSGTSVNVYVTLSTANNSEVDKKWTSVQYRVDAATTAQIQVFGSLTRSNEISVVVKTTYYLNEKTDQTNCANIYFRGDIATIVLRLRSAYL